MVLPAGYALERVAGGLRAAGQELPLALARHSRLGALEAAAISGGETPELAPGDVLTLTYAPSPAAVSAATSWYLLVRPAEAAATTASLRRTLGRPAPSEYALHSVRPNVASGEAKISFALPVTGTVRIEVFDLLGRRVRVLLDGEYAAGEHAVEWDGRVEDGSGAPRGVYLCRMTAGTYRAQRTMVRVAR